MDGGIRAAAADGAEQREFHPFDLCLDEQHGAAGDGVQHFIEEGNADSGGELSGLQLRRGHFANRASAPQVRIVMYDEYTIRRGVDVYFHSLRPRLQSEEYCRERILRVGAVRASMGDGERSAALHNRDYRQNLSDC